MTRRVLVVDDETNIRRMMRLTLSPTDMKSKMRRTGKRARPVRRRIAI